MNDMGGLRKYMPITHITFLIAALSISGVPGLAGFFSKDEILVATFESNKLLYIIGVFVAGLTAFYMFRLYFRIFWGRDTKYDHSPHESPYSMTIPMIFLAFMSVAAGYVHFNEYITADRMPFEIHFNYPLAAIATAVGLTGIALAYFFYKKETNLPDKVATAFGNLYKWTYQKFYIDEVYLFVTKKIIFNLIAAPAAWFDKHIVDGTMIQIGNTTVDISEKIKGIQSGKFQDYAMAFIGGGVVLAMVVFYVWTN
jgi:NADH-quinone oxidoreductase subunit L